MKKQIEKISTAIKNKVLKNPWLIISISILLGIMTLVWTMIIFSFSIQPAYKSTQVSEGLLDKILKFIAVLTNISIDPVPICGIFRKLAHFTEFFILGALATIFCYFVIYHQKIRNADFVQKGSPYLYSLLYGVFVAVSDELLQFFIGAGRSMQFTDMLIDSSGVVLSLIIIWKLYKLFNKNGGFWLFC